LRSQNAGQTGLNRLRQVEFSTFSRPTFAGQVSAQHWPAAIACASCAS
jgi:hypothetical protein